MAGSDMARSPEADVMRRQVAKLLERAIAKLPDTFRPVFVMREVEGLSVEETAEALQIPKETVKTRLFRARRRLQQELDPTLREALHGAFPFAGADCDGLTERVLARFLADRIAECIARMAASGVRLKYSLARSSPHSSTGRSAPMADAKTDQDGIGATWSLLTHLLDLLADKGVLSNQDLLALAETAHEDVSSGKKGAVRLKKLRDKVKARG
jgi:hypothetical protein